MPICIESFSLLNSDKYKINFLDIHSVSYYHEDLHKRIKESGIPVILGIGGRDLEEIKDRINYFGDQLSVLMVGFQSYPSKIENLKIEKIRLLNQLFPKVNIGYADHSSFDSEYAVTSNEWAYILGARFFEKHIAIEEGKERWDFQSAVGVEKMNSIKSKLDFLDNHVFKYSETELTSIDNEELVYRNRQKIAVAIKDLPKGHVLTEEDLGLKMIDNTSGLNSKHLLIGKTLNFSVEQGAKILLEDVS
jgi:N,N'-diacetyllegionaminate synthase